MALNEIDRSGFVRGVLQPGKGSKSKWRKKKKKKKTPVQKAARSYPPMTDAEFRAMDDVPTTTARSKSKPNVRKPTTKRSDKINRKDGGPIRLQSGGPVVDCYEY